MASFKHVHLKLAIILLAFMICNGFFHVPVNGDDHKDAFSCHECNTEVSPSFTGDCNTIDPKKQVDECRFPDNDMDESTRFCAIVNDEKENVVARLCVNEEMYKNKTSEVKKSGHKICKCSTDKCNGGKTCKADAVSTTTKKSNSVGSRLYSNGMFWTTGLLLIGYSLTSVIGNIRGSGRFSSY